MIKLEHLVRHAAVKDLDHLLELEALCWQKSLRASKKTLLKRLSIYPEGQFVLELSGKVIGVIYSQRISNENDLYKSNSENILKLHCADGKIVQLLAINIHPQYQERQFGDQLLEFMLQHCACITNIKKIVAVTRCRDYHKHKDTLIQDYIYKNDNYGRPYDPILLFHYLHGADIIGLVPGYRPNDIDNKGYGVLIQYDIHHRMRRDDVLINHTKNISEEKPLINTSLTSKEEVESCLQELINSILNQNKNNKLPNEISLIEMGLDSSDFLNISEQLTIKFKKTFSPTFFYQYNNLSKIISYLSDYINGSGETKKEHKEQTKSVNAEPYYSKEDIAIIGMACRLPGDIDTPQALWHFLHDGKNAINLLPKERWYWPEGMDFINKYRGLDKGGYLNSVAHFDAAFFNISSAEAKIMDPRQRILLELSWETLEDSGYSAERLSGSNTGVFIGASGSDYKLCLRDYPVSTDMNLAVGNSLSMLSNRLSFFYNFYGPSIVVDTACSSSFVALHNALQSLRAKECDQALVGGINIICHPQDTLSYFAEGLLSANGECKVFDDDADGYLRSEGAAMLMLKPLKQAMLDQDYIYAVIKGSANTHKGRTGGLTMPNPEEQAKLLQKAWKDAEIDPSTISYIEAHGTATKLGDAIELSGILSAFKSESNYPSSCAVGSIKSNLGHTEAAAGIIGLMKVALSLKHKQLLPSISFNKPNSLVELEDTPFYIVTDKQPWQTHSQKNISTPLRAGISCFGSGGTSVHVVLEEYNIDYYQSEIQNPEYYLIPFSAKNELSLQLFAQKILAFLEQDGNNKNSTFLSSFAYSMQCRQAMTERIAFLVSSFSELKQNIELLAQGKPIVDSFQGKISDINQVSNHNYSSENLKKIQEKCQLEEIAKLWANGMSINDWSWLYEQLPIKIKLPTYQFCKEYFWFNDINVPGILSKDINNKKFSDNQQVEITSRYTHSVSDGSNLSVPEKIKLTLQKLVAEQLDLPLADINNYMSYFAMGITSHQLIKLSCAIKQLIYSNFSPNLFFKYSNITDLASYLAEYYKEPAIEYERMESSIAEATNHHDDLLQAAQDSLEITNDTLNAYQPFPLNDIQEGYLGGRMLDSTNNVGCHIYLELDVSNYDIYRLNMAWKRLLHYHDMLRVIILPNGQQQILETIPVYQISVSDLRTKNENSQKEYLQELRQQMSHRVYKINEWPLFNIQISLVDNKKIMHFSIDELIVDAYSLRLLFNQWQQLYLDTDYQLPKLDISFRNYLLATKKEENSNNYNSDLEYWLNKLNTLPEGPALPQRTVAELNKDNSNRRRIRLDGILPQDKWQKLKTKCLQLNITPTAFLLTVFIEILREWSQQKTFSLILTFFNRLEHPQLEQIVGPFISTNIFIADQQSESSFAQFVYNNQATLYEDLGHMKVNGIKILRELKMQRKIPLSFSLPTVFTSLLGFEKVDKMSSFLDQVIFSVTQTPQVFLDHQIYENNGELRFSWDIAEEYYAIEIIKKIFHDYSDMLIKFGDKPDQYFRNVWKYEKKFLNVNLEKNIFPFAPFPHKRTQPFPLTDQQQAYAFGQSRHGGNLMSRIYTCFGTENLNVNNLEIAWEKVILTHPMLRTIIHFNGTQQLLEKVNYFSIKVNDLRGRNQDEIDKTLQRIESEILSKNTPLDQWPYFDLQVSLIDELKSYIHLSIDLIIADSPSIELIQKQLFYYYQNPDKPLASNAITFSDYIFSKQEYNQKSYLDSLHYWENKFANIVPGPEIPIIQTSMCRPERYRLHGVLEDLATLKFIAESLGVTVSRILLSAYTEILSAWSSSDKFSIVIPGWHRLQVHPEINQVVGDFTSMSWVVISKEKMSFKDKIIRIHETVTNDFAHQDVSWLKILRKATYKRRKEALMFPFVFTDIHQSSGIELPTDFYLQKSLTQTSGVYIDNLSLEAAGKLNLFWDVTTGIFPQGLAEEMFSGYQRLLGYLIANPEHCKEDDFSVLINANPQKYHTLINKRLAG